MKLQVASSFLFLSLLGEAAAFSPSAALKSKDSALFSSTASSTTGGSSTKELPQIQHRDTFDRDAWIGGFSNVPEEICYELPADFPKDIRGTFYQNGHGKFQVGDEIVVHPFDGDGHIAAVTFDNGKAWFRNRYVETKGFLDEWNANKVKYRGVFGTAKNKGKWWSNIFDIKLKNVANTHVLFRHGEQRLFALWEAGLPHEIDPITLETKGETDLDGTLADVKQYAAHYKIDPSTGNICNFVIGQGKEDPLKEHTLYVMEHDQRGNLLYKESHVFPRVGLNHDCAITDHYFVFFQTPTSVDPLPFVLGQKGIGQCFDFDNGAASSTLVLVPRGKGEPIEIEIPKSFTFHTGNAFEDPSDGTIVVDTIIADNMLLAADGDKGYPEKPVWETIDLQNEMVPYQLRRIRVDPKSKTFLSQHSMTDAAKTVEFPMVHPNYVGKPYRYTYCGASPSDTIMSPIQGICKIDVEAGEIIQKWLPPQPECFLGELSFVPRTNSDEEDDGYLVGFMLNGKEKLSTLVVFDAKNVAQGPIQECRLETFIPHALHGTFVTDFVPSMTEKVQTAYPPKRE